MKVLNYLNQNKVACGAVALTILGLGNGCCTRKTSTAYYHHPAPVAYSGGSYSGGNYSSRSYGSSATVQTARPAEGQTNLVVPLYRETFNVGKREVEAGSVRLRKIIKTETVNQPVELRHEEVVIDRDNGAGQGNWGQPFQEQETVINLKREVPVIEKQVTPAGRVVVTTRFAADQTNLQAQVRREDIDVNKIGNPQNVIIGQNVQGAYRESSAVGGSESAGGQISGVATSSGSAITDPAMIFRSSDPASLAGREVQLSGLKVQQVIDNRLFELTDSSGQRLYVVSTQPNAEVQTGDTVNVTGSVRPSAGSATAGLSGEGAQMLSSQPFFIEARNLESANK